MESKYKKEKKRLRRQKTKLSVQDKKYLYGLWYAEVVAPYVVKPEFGDGCTFSPDGFVLKSKYVSVVPCCVAHDRAYDSGGTEEERKNADKEFHKCLKCKIGWFRAWIYYRAVRRFGRFFFNFVELPLDMVRKK